jgi:hypothetical protein
MQMNALLLVMALALASFLSAYEVTFRYATSGRYMQTFWDGAYLRLWSVGDWGNSYELIRRVIWGTFAGLPLQSRDWPVTQMLGRVTWVLFPLLVIGLLIIAIASLVKSGRAWLALLLSAPLAALGAASSVGAYPIATRLTLFALPSIALLLGEAIGALAQVLPERRRVLGVVCLVLPLVLLGLPSDGKWRLADAQWSKARTMTAWAPSTGEPVYVYSRGVPQFLYYAVDWSQPDTALIGEAYALTRPGAIAFENRSGYVAPDEIAALNLEKLRTKGIVLGLPDGMAFAYMRGWNRLEPDPRWASSEIARLSAAASRGTINILAFQNIDAAAFTLKSALASADWKCRPRYSNYRELALGCERAAWRMHD